MFCKYCGKSLPDTAQFCSGCGKSLSAATPDRATHAFIVRPTFCLLPVFVKSMPIAAPVFLVAFWIGLSLTDKNTHMAGGGDHEYIGPLGTVVFVAAMFAIVAIFICMAIIKGYYDNMAFRFFADRVEYIEGFLRREKKMVKYQNITEVNLQQGMAQRLHGLSDITLSLPSGLVEGVAQGINLPDVENGDRLYERIRAIVQQVS